MCERQEMDMKKKMAVSNLEFTVNCTMSDVQVHLIQGVQGRGNEHELPRAGITLMTLRAALCTVTSDLCSSSSPEDRHMNACAGTRLNVYISYLHGC